MKRRIMVLRAPFVRWARIKNPSPTSPRATLFYLQIAEGSKVSCALAIRGPTNRITYTAFGAFLDEYRQILPMGAVAQWRFSSMFAQWLDGLLYHSFLLCSEEGVSDAWHLDYVASASSCQKFEVRLREAFREFDLEEMVIRMGDCVWNIPINDLQLDVQMFARFFAALDLSYLDFLLVLMLSTMEFRVVVFPLDSDIDRIYSWF